MSILAKLSLLAAVCLLSVSTAEAAPWDRNASSKMLGSYLRRSQPARQVARYYAPRYTSPSIATQPSSVATNRPTPAAQDNAAAEQAQSVDRDTRSFSAEPEASRGYGRSMERRVAPQHRQPAHMHAESKSEGEYGNE